MHKTRVEVPDQPENINRVLRAPRALILQLVWGMQQVLAGGQPQEMGGVPPVTAIIRFLRISRHVQCSCAHMRYCGAAVSGTSGAVS